MVIILHTFYRCGVLFCKQCMSYERRLNRNGNFDPAGKLFKVLHSIDNCRFLFIVFEFCNTLSVLFFSITKGLSAANLHN